MLGEGDMRLQKAKLEDCLEIYNIQIKAFQSLLDKYQDYDTNPGAENIDRTYERFKKPFIDYWIIQVGSEKIGVIRVRNFGKVCILNQIAILPTYQNRGYGQEAIRAVEAEYPEAIRWELDTILQEEKLCYIYEKMGYVKTGQVENIKIGMDLAYFGKDMKHM